MRDIYNLEKEVEEQKRFIQWLDDNLNENDPMNDNHKKLAKASLAEMEKKLKFFKERI